GRYAMTLNFGTGPSPTVPLPNTQTPNGNPIVGGGGQADKPGNHQDGDDPPGVEILPAPATPVSANPAASVVRTSASPLPPLAVAPITPALLSPAALVPAHLTPAQGTAPTVAEQPRVSSPVISGVGELLEALAVDEPPLEGWIPEGRPAAAAETLQK